MTTRILRKVKYMKHINSNHNPLVSVIMPVYNAGSFLMPAIKSILNQTYKNIELIIVNDCSSDNSLNIILEFKKLYPNVITVLNLKKTLNRGGDSCANKGLEAAKGTYVARMDADDVAHPTRIEKQAAYLEAHPSTFLVGSNAYVIDENGKTIGEKNEPQNHADIFYNYFTYHPIIHPSAMYRREHQGKPFYYTLKYSANNDYYSFFKIICGGAQFANLPEKLLYYRVHKNNNTFNNIKIKFMNTLKTRISMVKTHGYMPTAKQIGITCVQFVGIMCLPEFILARLYLVSKGIIKPGHIFKKIFSFLYIYQ